MSMTEKEAFQSFFDQACAGVLQQGCLAADPDGCYNRYHREDGSVIKCVIGQMLTDRQMKRWNISDTDPVSRFPEGLIRELIPNVEPDIAETFMRNLQMAHDQMQHKKFTGEQFAETFKAQANEVALLYGLKPLD